MTKLVGCPVPPPSRGDSSQSLSLYSTVQDNSVPDRLVRKAILTGRDAYKQCIDKASVVLVDCPEDACKDEGDESEADCD